MWDWQAIDGQEHDVAAKTGTTDSFKDNWTLGYTSNVVVGVWSGNADGEEFLGHVVGITGAAPIWHDVIEYVSGRCLYGSCSDIKFPTDKFVPPPGVSQQTVSSVNGLVGGGDTDWMLQGEEPQQSGLGH
jgi:membrane carboxypeptidase/penicillin-binding protein PbpC